MKISFRTYNVIYALWTLFVLNMPFLKELAPTLSPFVLVIVTGLLFLWLLLLQGLIFWRKTTKLFSIVLLITNAIASYFIETYHLGLNKMVIGSVFETNFFEATEWLGKSFWLYIGWTAVIPSLLILKTKIVFSPFKVKIREGAFILLIYLMGVLGIVLPNRSTVKIYLKQYFSLRYTFVPTSYIASTFSYGMLHLKKVDYINTMEDFSQTKYGSLNKPSLIVFVLGESARDSNFSLSGYGRDTAAPLRPFLKDMVVFHKTESCGVVTRVSVPCMFSAYRRENYVEEGANSMANALDILAYAHFNILWLDNELGCNKVCRNVKTEFTCHTRDCRDDTLNKALMEKASTLEEKNHFIVLHQRGSHGPRYDLRVPEEYRLFSPYCEREDYTKCSTEELVNAYDNTIYYTSQSIADTIRLLEGLKDKYHVMLIYISDHGESLGEGGFYGHNGDFDEAPYEQKNVPFFMWIPKETQKAFGFSMKCLNEKTKKHQSQDVIFHSLLGLAGIRTKVYDASLDLFTDCHD